MGVWVQATETTRAGRWHCRMHDPATNVVSFTDVFSDTPITAQEALDQAQAANPTQVVEWSVWEPNRYGIWANGFGAGAPIGATTGREG